MSDHPHLSIRLLGQFRVIHNGESVPGFHSGRLQSLLSYLLLHAGEAVSRAQLAATYWPDTEEEQARSNLRTLLHRLRRLLPCSEHYLDVDASSVSWRGGRSFDLDVHQFMAAATAAQADPALLPRCVALFGGDLLPGCYDDEWVLSERERLKGLFIQALERLADHYERQREYGPAGRVTERLLDQEPLEEHNWRRLMRLYALQGNRARALQAYRRCCAVLRRELDIEPGPATVEAYEGILRAGGPAIKPGAGDPAAEPPLVGRHQEWALVRECCQAVLEGSGPHLLIIAGEAGIGKSRLAREAYQWAVRQGIRAAATRTYEAEGSLAYAPVTTLLRSLVPQPGLAALDDVWVTEVARLVPEILAERPHLPPPGPLTQGWQRERFFAGLVRAVLPSGGPLLLLFDDLQWCDPETLAWLHYLLRCDASARLAVVGTLRSEAPRPPALAALVSSLQQRARVTALTLDPLGPAETAVLGGQLAGRALPEALAASLYQQTDGNPLFVVEGVRAGWLETPGGGGGGAGALPAGTGPAAGQHTALPDRVRAVIAWRLALLSRPARQVADLAAVIGRQFDLPVLARAGPADEEQLVQSLEQLRQKGVIREQDGDAYDFTHDRIREVLYAGLGRARRRLLHRHIARALEAVHPVDRNAVSAQLAGHYEQAGLWQVAAAYYLQAAGVSQRMYANQDAIGHFRRALRLLAGAVGGAPVPEGAPMAARLHEGLGDVLALTGNQEQARQAFRAALDSMAGGDRLGCARQHHKIGNTLREERDYTGALTAYDDAERLLSHWPGAPSPPEDAVVRAWLHVQMDRMQLHYWRGDLPDLQRLMAQVRPMIEPYGAATERALFHSACGRFLVRRDRYVVSDEVLRVNQAFLDAARELGEDHSLYGSALFGGSATCGATNWTRPGSACMRLWPAPNKPET